VLQIRDNVSHLSMNPETEGDAKRLRARSRSTVPARGLEGLTSPVEGLFSARDAVMLFRNDAMLEGLSALFRARGFAEDFVSTTVFEFRGEASLSWTLSQDEIDAMVAQLRVDGIQVKLRAIDAWLGGAPDVER
jgi:hypothetical protein